MAGWDTWRTIGWGPIELPGERSAAERASTETRTMLRNAGLLVDDDDATPAPESPQPGSTAPEVGSRPAESGDSTSSDGPSIVASPPTGELAISPGEFESLSVSRDVCVRAIQAAATAARAKGTNERYSMWGRLIANTKESAQWSVVWSDGNDADVLGGAGTRQDAAELARKMLRRPAEKFDAVYDRRAFLIVYSVKSSSDQGIDLFAPKMRFYFDFRQPPQSESPSWDWDKVDSLRVSFNGDDLGRFLGKDKGGGR